MYQLILHDASLRSWVPGANGHRDFPIQNLPIGIFSPLGGARRAGVAIGDQILDITAPLTAGFFSGNARLAVEATSGSSLNTFLALDPEVRKHFVIAFPNCSKPINGTRTNSLDIFTTQHRANYICPR